MNPQVATGLTGELAALLERLIELQDSLHAVLHEKLDAMRRADTEGMLSAVHREGKLVTEVAAMDEQRRVCVSQMCGAVGIQKDAGNAAVPLRVLAARLDPALRQRLVKLGDVLREKMLKVAEANRVVETVSREMLKHFRTLLAAMTCQDGDAPTYSPRGDVGTSSGSRVLDAMG